MANIKIDNKIKDQIVDHFVDYYNDEYGEEYTKDNFSVESLKVEHPFNHNTYDMVGITCDETDEEFIIANEDAREAFGYVKLDELLNDMGIGDFLDWNRTYVEDYLTKDAIDSLRQQVEEFFFDNITEMLDNKEDYEGELADLSIEYGISLDDKNFAYDTAEKKTEAMSDDEIFDYYKEINGISSNAEFAKNLYKQNFIDIRKLFDYIFECDGYGPTLAIYDGEEIDLSGAPINGEYYSIYRQN